MNRSYITRVVAIALLFYQLLSCSKVYGFECLERPNSSSVKIASIDEAFDLILNNKNRSKRYSATLYLKAHLGVDMIKQYGILLFKVSHRPAREKIYESMGFFGGNGIASLLAVYLESEEPVEIKAKIICSLGHVGSDANQFIKLIKDVNNEYSRLRKDNPNRRSYVVRSRNRSWFIRDDSLSQELFSRVSEGAISKIQSGK